MYPIKSNSLHFLQIVFLTYFLILSCSMLRLTLQPNANNFFRCYGTLFTLGNSIVAVKKTSKDGFGPNFGRCLKEEVIVLCSPLELLLWWPSFNDVCVVPCHPFEPFIQKNDWQGEFHYSYPLCDTQWSNLENRGHDVNV